MNLRSIFTFVASTLFAITSSYSQGDNPCDAQVLTVANGSACTRIAGTTVGATNTPNIPAPGCASYSGPDVWYKVIVPPTGTLRVSTFEGTITDGGMAIYSAPSCSGNFTLIECNDDGGTGLMPLIERSGLTPGQEIYIRVWKYGSSSTRGTFSICANSPVPPDECIGGDNPDCNSAQGFCTEMPEVNYCNIQSSNLGRYSCLGSTPNAMWLYMQVEDAGDINVTIHQTSDTGRAIDVDFALYGPYTNLADGCGTINPSTPTVDCSYSSSATEEVNVPNAQPGQVYVLLVTNYNGAQGSIGFSNNGSTGATDCSIIQPCQIIATAIPDTCAQGVGAVTTEITHGLAPYTYAWSSAGNPTTADIANLVPGSYSVTMTTDDGCTSTSTVVVGNETVTASSSTTLISCLNGNDGTATATISPANGTQSYLWSNGETTQTITGLTAGDYTCEITSSNGCTATAVATVSEIPSINVIVNSFTDVSCNKGNDGKVQLLTTNGTAPYTYTWATSPSATAANQNFADDLSVGDHDVLIVDANGCEFTISQTLDEPLPLRIVASTPDTQICPENTASLTVTVEGGSSDYIYNWSSNGIEIGNTQEIVVDPTITNTEYCVAVTEACGTSDSVKTCITITFPTPIPPQLTLKSYEECTPGLMEFTNTSPNIGELESTYIDFGDTKNDIFLNGDSGSHVYITPRDYTLTVVNTSVFGCVYSTVLEDFFKVLPAPTARFNFSTNPTSVFETTVPVYNKSTEDVIQWQWTVPGAVPSQSNLENPIFKFPEGDEAEFPVTLVVTSIYGCTDTLTLNLKIEDQILFFAPNSFTPNGDEFNNIWKLSIKGIDIYNYSLSIYNRWGEMVFESFDPSMGWDGTYNGKLVPSGQYSWKATIRNKNNDGKEVFTGSLNILK